METWKLRADLKYDTEYVLLCPPPLAPRPLCLSPEWKGHFTAITESTPWHCCVVVPPRRGDECWISWGHRDNTARLSSDPIQTLGKLRLITCSQFGWLSVGFRPQPGSIGAFEIFDVKNVTMIARITASKNGGVQAAQKGFGFASRKRSPGILKTS